MKRLVAVHPGQPGFRSISMMCRKWLAFTLVLFVGAGQAWATRFVLPQRFDGDEGLYALSTCALSNGNFVVGWAHVPVDDAAAQKDLVYRIFAPDGTPLTGELTAGTSITGPSGRVYCDASGGFVYSFLSGPWGGQADTNYVRRFNNQGEVRIPANVITRSGGRDQPFRTT